MIIQKQNGNFGGPLLDHAGSLQVATVLAVKNTKEAAFASSMLQQEALVNDNFRGQGLPEGKVLSISYPEVSQDLIFIRTIRIQKGTQIRKEYLLQSLESGR
jgi:hypothetical protein